MFDGHVLITFTFLLRFKKQSMNKNMIITWCFSDSRKVFVFKTDEFCNEFVYYVPKNK